MFLVAGVDQVCRLQSSAEQASRNPIAYRMQKRKGKGIKFYQKHFAG
jgi:hypothetical protein